MFLLVSYTNTDIFRFMCEDIWQRLDPGSGVNTKRFYLDSWVQGSGRIKIYITLNNESTRFPWLYLHKCRRVKSDFVIRKPRVRNDLIRQHVFTLWSTSYFPSCFNSGKSLLNVPFVKCPS